MKVADYLNIIADQLQSYMVSAYSTRIGIFPQDNVPCHKARIGLEWQINLEVDSYDVQELLDSQIQELAIEELIEMHQQELNIEELEFLVPVQSERMTVGNLIEGLS
ncbi:hypothetical protein TNCV_160231 [Trichonephila clavipes]|nr:hypothetical protein TNCV_160231 [Trichonephila clavipes]